MEYPLSWPETGLGLHEPYLWVVSPHWHRIVNPEASERLLWDRPKDCPQRGWEYMAKKSGEGLIDRAAPVSPMGGAFGPLERALRPSPTGCPATLACHTIR
jgi:hypothetical protein